MLKVFLLEDMQTDQELIKMQILKIAPDTLFTIAANRDEFLEKINWTVPDIILADHHLPGFSGTEALAYAKEQMPHVPFVFVTSTLNDEEEASKSILHGAADYILKDNLQSLPDRILAVLETAKIRFQREEEKRSILRKQKLLLQKLRENISQAESFTNKDETLEILKMVTLNLERFTQLNVLKGDPI